MRKTALLRKEPAVLVQGNELWTTSAIVAAVFGKNHKDVLRAVDRLECSSDFSRRNFAPSNYLDGRGKEQRMYRISEAGFMFLAMGFTGKEAARWKEWFVAEFERMRRYLRSLAKRQADPDWQRARLEGKGARKAWGETTARFVEYARSQDSKGAVHYFKHLTTAEYRALFLVEGETGVPLRDALSAEQLTTLEVLERAVARDLEEGMAQGLPYKSVFERAKAKMAAFAEIVGRTSVKAQEVPALDL